MGPRRVLHSLHRPPVGHANRTQCLRFWWKEEEGQEDRGRGGFLDERLAPFPNFDSYTRPQSYYHASACVCAGYGMHSSAGKSSYRYGKSERAYCHGVTGTLQTWTGVQYTGLGRRGGCVVEPFARCLPDGKAALRYVGSRALSRAVSRRLGQ